MAPALPQALSRWLNISYPSCSSIHVFEANNKNKRRQLLQQRKQQPIKLILIAVSFVWILLLRHIYIILTKLLTLHCILQNSNVTQTLQKSSQNLSLVTHSDPPDPPTTPAHPHCIAPAPVFVTEECSGDTSLREIRSYSCQSSPPCCSLHFYVQTSFSALAKIFSEHSLDVGRHFHPQPNFPACLVAGLALFSKVNCEVALLDMEVQPTLYDTEWERNGFSRANGIYRALIRSAFIVLLFWDIFWAFWTMFDAFHDQKSAIKKWLQ